MRIYFSQESVTVLQKMANYQEARVKLTNAKLNKFKSGTEKKDRNNTKIKQEKVWRWRIATWIISNNKTNN